MTNADTRTLPVALPGGKWMTKSLGGSGTYYYVWRTPTYDEAAHHPGTTRMMVDNWASHMEPMPDDWPDEWKRAAMFLGQQSGRQESGA